MAHAKGILRQVRPPFTMVDNRLAQDSRLSFRARGTGLYMASLPDGWDFSIERIAREGREGREAVAASIRELKTYGYVMVQRIQDEATGRFRTVTLIDASGAFAQVSPGPENPQSGEPDPGEPGSGDRGLEERHTTKRTDATPPRSRSAPEQPATSEPEVAREPESDIDAEVIGANVTPEPAVEPEAPPPPAIVLPDDEGEDEPVPSPPKPRARDPYWDALAAVFPTTTQGERGMIGAAKRELLSIVPQPPPELVERAARWVRTEWPGCTPKALTQHWSLAVERSGRRSHGRAPAASANPNVNQNWMCSVCGDGTPAFANTGYCKPHLHEAEAAMGRSRA